MDKTMYALLGVGVGLGIAGFVMATRNINTASASTQKPILTDIVRNDQGRITEVTEMPINKSLPSGDKK